MTIVKTIAIWASTINAITKAPNTIKGDLKKSRKNILIPLCIWLTSLVILVNRVELPKESKSLCERV